MAHDDDDAAVQRPSPALSPPGVVARADAFLERQSGVVIWALCAVAYGVVFATDVLTGPELEWAIFYMLPVGICAWYLGWQRAIAMAVAAGFGWFLAGYDEGAAHVSSIAGLWNPVGTTLLFMLVAYTLVLLREALRHEQELARTDWLTGVANSRSFLELAARELARAQRREQAITMAYLDVDRFKNVNDTRGHAAGDAILREIAAALRDGVRNIDVVARLGGDEFAMLLTEVDAEGAPAVMERVFQRLSAVAARHRCGIGFSLGVVTFDPPVHTLDEMIRAADDAMYTVKRAGGDRILYLHGHAQQDPMAASERESRSRTAGAPG